MCEIYHIFFIHSSIHGQLDCFYILAIVSDAAMNKGRCVYVLNYLEKYPVVELLGHIVYLLLVIGISILFSTGAAPVCSPTNGARGSPFLHMFTNILFVEFLIIAILLWGGISLWFWFAFSWWLVMLSIFSYVCWPSYVFLGEMSFHVLCPFFWLNCLFFVIELYEFLI